MFKKNLLILSCFIGIGVFAGNSSANAQDLETLSPITSNLLRGEPVKKEAVISSGQKIEIQVGSLRANELVSKYVIKFKAESDNKESFLLEEVFDHGYAWQAGPKRFFYTNTTETVNYNLLDEPVKGWTSGTRIFRLYNYSAKPLKITFALNSSIHPRSIECVNYSDIDFTL